MNQLLFGGSKQLLQEIDRKMGILESILQHISGYVVAEIAYEIHQMLLEVTQLLLMLEQDHRMIVLVKGLSLQLLTIQEQYNQIMGVD
ncbi:MULTISPECIES: hypothetical protein [Bacillus]|uniref:Uncharacterized protein n=1 Tax=Bacillus cereus TaxID=1396 RepID=A0A9X6GD13_BACCE|nr:hypothetical protein [Bacillus cereus]OOR71596.1 hypothetical protein BLX06_29790 [Bacillus cereus]